MPFIYPTVAPTGGTIALDIILSPGLDVQSAPIALYRQAGSLTSSLVLLYSGVCTPVFIDDGEQLPNYLDFGTPYFYTVIDQDGSYTTEGIIPASQIQLYSGYLDKLLLRLFSAGYNSLAVPQGYNKIRVLQAMPLTMGSDGSLFPFVVMNLDLEQQEFLGIGEAVLSNPTNNQRFAIGLSRRYSVNICSLNAQERDYYKDATQAIFYSIQNILTKIGQTLEMHLQSAQSQASDDDKTPGFYISTTMLEFQGTFGLNIVTTYPLINSITGVVSATTEVPSGYQVVFDI